MQALLRRSGRRALVWLSFLAVTVLSSCETGTEPPDRISFDAVVQVFVLEGPSTFVLDRTDSDESYYPLNLPPEFQVEGARVHVEGLLIRHYQVLLHPPVEILSITRLE